MFVIVYTNRDRPVSTHGIEQSQSFESCFNLKGSEPLQSDLNTYNFRNCLFVKFKKVTFLRRQNYMKLKIICRIIKCDTYHITLNFTQM